METVKTLYLCGKSKLTAQLFIANKRTSEQAIREYLEHVEDASLAEIIGLSQARTRVILAEMRDENDEKIFSVHDVCNTCKCVSF